MGKGWGEKILYGFLWILFFICMIGGITCALQVYLFHGLAKAEPVIAERVTESPAATEESLPDTAKNKEEPEKVKAPDILDQDITNMALFGVDSRNGEGAFDGRSDMIMVISIDKEQHTVKLTSILRDTRIYMGDLSPYKSGYDKLNHAYAYGGAEGMINLLNETFGLDIEDYATINFSSAARIIDLLGGADVELTEEEIPYLAYYGAPYDGEPGMAHLNGAQAVAYGRIRYVGNDNERALRQQEVICSLFDHAKNLPKWQYPTLIHELSPLTETSLGFDDILGLASFALTDFTVENLTIPSDIEGYESGYFEGGGWMWDYDLDTAKDHIHTFIYGE